MRFRWIFIALVVALAALYQPRAASASAIFDVSVDTSALTGPLSLFFQLTDGGDTGGNNTVILSRFKLGGGSASSDGPELFGGASGSLGGGITLEDTEFLNYFLQGFTPGALLSFQLRLPAFADTGDVPDAFAFSLLDADGFPIPTSDPTGADTLLTIHLNAEGPAIEGYGAQVTPVPEPASLTLLGVGLAGWAVRSRSRARSKSGA